MTLSNSVMIAITEAKAAVQRAVADEPDLSLEGRLRAAFAVTRHHWVVVDEEKRFRAGVGGAMLLASVEERERLEAELRALATLSAAIAGVPVDIGGLAEFEPVGLLGIWQSIP